MTKRGRPKKEVTADQFIGIRLMAEELEVWRKAAGRMGFGNNLSGYIRSIVNSQAAHDILTSLETDERLVRRLSDSSDGSGGLETNFPDKQK